MKIPEKLKIEDGHLKCIDGSSLRQYLKKWQQENNIEDGQSVNISSHEGLGQLSRDAELAKGWGA